MTLWSPSRQSYHLALAVALTLGACNASDRGAMLRTSGIEPLPSPAGPFSGEPNLAGDQRGRVHMTWLEKARDSATALRYAIFDGAAWSTPRTITERSDFFVNWADFPSVFVSPTGRVMVHWLQRSSAGRYSYDVRISQSSDDGATWSTPALLNRDEPAKVYADNWQIAACPVNGPAVAARGDTVVVAWFTGANDTARVRAAFSTDAGATFGPPIRIDQGKPAGRVDVELEDAGQAVISWLENTGSQGAEVRVRPVTIAGDTMPALTVTASSSSRASGFARLAHRGHELVIAWTQPGDTARVRIAKARLGGGSP